jgi:hypothetical protein
MNPENNGNRAQEMTQDEPTSFVEPQEKSVATPATPEMLDDAKAGPTFVTRMDALKTATTNRKPIVLLGVGLGAAVLLFVITSFFGKAPSKKLVTSSQNGGQTTTSAKPKGSVTPLMDTVHSAATSDTSGQVTPADISRTKASFGGQNPPTPVSPTPPHSKAATGASLASVPPFESTQQRWEEPKPYGEQPVAASPATSANPSNLLKEASLVFIKKSEQVSATAPSNAHQSGDDSPELLVAPGTRIQARLEMQASSAVSAPVVAVVEYTYSLGGHLVIPAGARVYGQLQQADRSGAVSIKFNEIQFLDGVREKIEAIGASLELGPIKGIVTGKNTGRNFLVRTASGIGSIAAMVVGNNNSGAFSEDDLIRQRIAENAGTAGDTEIMNMALTSRIVVSVPADTPIYIVFTKRSDTVTATRKEGTAAN